MSTVPAAPKRVLVGHELHAEMRSALLRDRPDLDVRGKSPKELTEDDLLWAEAFLGFRRPALPTLGNIGWVHSTGAGVDPWLYPVELPSNILLTRSSESFGPMIAEWALSRALAFLQGIIPLSDSQRKKQWSKFDVPMLAGTTALVIGTGDVGGHCGMLFKALGCRVRGVSRSGKGDPSIFESVVPVSELATAVEGADWIIVMLPLTKDTDGLVSREVLSHCRNAVFMNAGRGACVEERALPEALEKGWLRGAALDVFEVEPLPTDSPLWSDERVMISPHIAGLTTMEGAVSGFVECLADLEKGKAPRWIVTRDKQY